MNQQDSQGRAQCVSTQPCLADSGIDSASLHGKLDVLAVAEIGTASIPLELGVAETRLDALCYPSSGSRTRHRLGAAGNKGCMNSAAFSNLDSKQPELDAAGTRRLGAAPLPPSLPPFQQKFCYCGDSNLLEL